MKIPEPDHVDHVREMWARQWPELDTWPVAVVARVGRLARYFDQGLERMFAEHGLRRESWDALASLRRAGPPYRLRPTDFAATLMLTSSGTTKRLDRLEAAGHITREPDPADRRGVLIRLTDGGRALIDQAAGRHLANEQRILGGLTAAERDELAGLLRKLGTTLPPPGP